MVAKLPKVVIRISNSVILSLDRLFIVLVDMGHSCKALAQTLHSAARVKLVWKRMTGEVIDSLFSAEKLHRESKILVHCVEGYS
jgi:hypothetical protein